MSKMRKILICMAVVISMLVGSTGISAYAKEENERTNIYGYAQNRDIVTRATSGTFNYSCTSTTPHKLGKIKANGTTMTIKFGAAKTGKAVIEIHKGSYTGSVVSSVIVPEQGTTSTTLSSTFSVTKDTYYYIVVKTTGGYAAASGSFTLSY